MRAALLLVALLGASAHAAETDTQQKLLAEIKQFLPQYDSGLYESRTDADGNQVLLTGDELTYRRLAVTNLLLHELAGEPAPPAAFDQPLTPKQIAQDNKTYQLLATQYPNLAQALPKPLPPDSLERKNIVDALVGAKNFNAGDLNDIANRNLGNLRAARAYLDRQQNGPPETAPPPAAKDKAPAANRTVSPGGTPAAGRTGGSGAPSDAGGSADEGGSSDGGGSTDSGGGGDSVSGHPAGGGEGAALGGEAADQAKRGFGLKQDNLAGPNAGAAAFRALNGGSRRAGGHGSMPGGARTSSATGYSPAGRGAKRYAAGRGGYASGAATPAGRAAAGGAYSGAAVSGAAGTASGMAPQPGEDSGGTDLAPGGLHGAQGSAQSGQASQGGEQDNGSDELTDEEKKELADIQKMLKDASNDGSTDGPQIADALDQLPQNASPAMSAVEEKVARMLGMSGRELTMAERQQVMALASQMGLSPKQVRALPAAVEHGTPPPPGRFNRDQPRWQAWWLWLRGLAAKPRPSWWWLVLLAGAALILLSRSL